MAIYKVSGKILSIGEKRTFSEKFSKQTLVLSMMGNLVKGVARQHEFTLINDKIAYLREFKVNDYVTIDFILDGNNWNGKVINSTVVSTMQLIEPEKGHSSDPTPDDDLPF